MRLHFSAGPPRDYLSALSQLRWRREFATACASSDGTLEVFDERSLPAPGSGEALAAARRKFADAAIFPLDSGAVEEDLKWSAPDVSTLREFQEACGAASQTTRPVASRPKDPAAGSLPSSHPVKGSVVAEGFRVVRLRESFGARAEILRRLPAGARRLLDVGCGDGETAAEAKRRFPGLVAAGIDRHPELAGRARENLDEFFFGDALTVLRQIARGPQRYDLLVFADVLEHTEDPWAVLECAREVALPAARLVVSVPNAGNFSLIGDLVRGRFDPIGAGIEDCGHLRWFTRGSLCEMLEDAGFVDLQAEAVPAPGTSAFFFDALSSLGIAHRAEELAAIQWIATGRLGPRQSTL
jgi:SAM-dependent methyltransferase